MPLKLTNLATSLLAANITNVATTLALTSGDEAKFPSLGAGEYFPVTVVDNAGNREIMKCTARSGVTLTVVRAQEGTTAFGFSAGARVDLRLTAATILALLDRANHTGTQTMASISDLAARFTDVDDDIAAALALIALRATINNPVFTGTVTLAQDPAANLQAATKQYVDALAINIGKRGRVRAASTANINLASPGAAIGGVTMALTTPRQQFLNKNASSPAQNGVYDWNGASSAATRTAEFDTYDEHAGALIAVQEGTNAETVWLCTSNVGGTLNTTAIDFAQPFPSQAQALWEAGTGTVEGLVSPAKIEAQIKQRAYDGEIVATWDWSTNVTLVAFPDLGAYQRLDVIIEDLTLSAIGRPLLQVSVDNGANYLTTGYASRAFNDNSGVTRSDGLVLSDDDITTAGLISYELRRFNMNAKAFGSGIGGSGNDGLTGQGPSGINNALRLTTTTGVNLTGGKVTIFGWRSR